MLQECLNSYFATFNDIPLYPGPSQEGLFFVPFLHLLTTLHLLVNLELNRNLSSIAHLSSYVSDLNRSMMAFVILIW